MNSWLFFGSDGSELVERLEWRLAVRKLETSILESKMRACAEGHIEWLEREISAQSALQITT